MQGTLGDVTFRRFSFDSRPHQSSEPKKKSLTDRILMALRGLVWVDASANRVATACTCAPLRNRRLTERRTLGVSPSRKGALCVWASPKGAFCMRAVAQSALFREGPRPRMRFSVRVRAQNALFRRVCFSLPAQTWSHLTQRRILRRRSHVKAQSATVTSRKSAFCAGDATAT